ncbi:MAG TPA: hypothetical protein VG247_01110 [Pseudonocardiaceae bacterium]|jgi:hypothetical protein|nr:hypothetical protein [Pseudonocardiaceae bacterium]
MATTKTQDVAAGIDLAMKQLRRTMRGLQVRTAGFKRDHDHLARAMAVLTVTLVDAEALLHAEASRRRRRR